MAAYPAIFNLLKDNGTAHPAERMNTLTSLLLQEMPSLLIIIGGLTLHLRVLWGIEKNFSYANNTALDDHNVAFSRDIVAGDTSPIITISPNW